MEIRDTLAGVGSWSDSESVHLFRLQQRVWLCGDGCCDEGENYVTCPDDCFGCGDGYCLWSENPCSCPQDCLNTSCGDGCLSGDETCTNCALDCGELFSLDTPRLTGYYSCAWGLCSRESSFDFGKQFLSVSDAWLHVVGSGDDKICAPYQFGLTTYLDGFRALESVDVTAVSSFAVNVPIFPTPAVFDGQGTLGLSVGVVSYNCFDIGGSVSDATLWFRAVRAPRTTNLLDVATFQRCFQVDEVGVEPRCAEFDFDKDLDIDLGDYPRFRMSLGGP